MKRSVKAIIICIIWAILIIWDHYIDKYLGGLVHFISICAILVLTVLILINIVKEFINIYKCRRHLSWSVFAPLMLYLSVPFLGGLIDPAKLESTVVMRGCYEGTQNQAYLFFRADNTFELNWTGVFFYDKWYTGSWKKSKDTIVLQYNGDTVKALGDKVIIRDGYFKPVGKHADTVKYHKPMFYLGYCKGEN
ncbi:hypothetical protein HQ865_17660 [Mucilaginibacter mali]|uniref:Uncharacterized protein n=1 Tax=Mucilaginibacter mali TaxID=2740462 RepID=A0A7D4QGY5_9SPHI|nr:hypothetical protein [Mucilaginibacter mali]QKJ31512.1 hypothetical protein HQ865_17660 [Mucilaginibacter mali]